MQFRALKGLTAECVFQQDALEFFQYLLELMTRAERAAGARLGPDAAGAPTADAFAYQLEDRKQVGFRG